MAIDAPESTRYGLANKALADVTTAARACDSWLHAIFKALTGTVVTGFTAGTGGAPPSSSFWTVERTCNGTTASAADNFNNTFTAAEWVSNTAGNTHSWFVIKSPVSPGISDGPWYMMISKDSATATTYRVAISKTAFAGGTTTANPTNAGTVSEVQTSLFNTSSTTAGYAHLMTDAKGNFWALCSRVGSGVVETGIIFTEFQQPQASGDSYRVICYAMHSTSGLFSSVHVGTNISGTGILGFQKDGTAVGSSQIVISAHNLTGFTELGMSNNVEGLKFGLVYSTKASNMCVRGWIPDTYQVTGAVANGASYPDTTDPIWTSVGSTSTSGGKVLIPFPNVLTM